MRQWTEFDRTVSIPARIAIHVFKESVRDKVLYGLVLFAIILIASSYFISQLTAGQDVKIIKDLGLATIQAFGLFFAVFIGTGLVSKEVERRSIYSLLSKPVRRHEMILGKYVGLVLTLAVNVAIMIFALYALLGYIAWTTPENVRAAWDVAALDPVMLRAVVLIFSELMLVTAIALFFSIFLNTILSAVLTMSLYVVGQFNADLRNFEAVVDSQAVAFIAQVAYYLLPNFASFDIKAEVVHAVPVPLVYIALTGGYAVSYIGALLMVSMVIFSQRDFK